MTGTTRGTGKRPSGGRGQRETCVRVGTAEWVSCKGDQRVKVFRKRRGHDRKLGQAITTPNGRYRVHQERHPGRYYAKTGETVIPSAGRCEEARSKVRRLR